MTRFRQQRQLGSARQVVEKRISDRDEQTEALQSASEHINAVKPTGCLQARQLELSTMVLLDARGAQALRALASLCQRGSKSGHHNPPCRIDKPLLALERLATQARHQPVGDQSRRERTQIGCRHSTD